MASILTSIEFIFGSRNSIGCSLIAVSVSASGSRLEGSLTKTKCFS
jgi:hypothetical protein